MLSRSIIREVQSLDFQGIEDAALLAFIETESAGRPFEKAGDGTIPTMLFERHLFYKYLPAAKRAEGVRLGLALKKRSPKTQYLDQKTSAQKLALFARARALDEEAAIDATSWGLGQICGFNAETCGYENATDMFAKMSKNGVTEQIKAIVAYLRANGLVDDLARKDWKAVAKGYNGPKYAENKYDVKMRAAYARYASVLDEDTDEAPKGSLRVGDEGPRVRALQMALCALGFNVKVDGDFGPELKRQVGAAQVHYSMLPATGIATPAFVDALDDLAPLDRGARAEAKMSDIRPDSAIVKAADSVQGTTTAGVVIKAVQDVDLDAATTALSDIQDKADKANDAYEMVSAYTGIFPRIGAFCVAHPGLVIVVVAGIVIIGAAYVIKRSRLNDHRTGKTL